MAAARSFEMPSATQRLPVGIETAVGVLTDKPCVFLVPVWPELLSPQAYSSPSAVSASELS